MPNVREAIVGKSCEKKIVLIERKKKKEFLWEKRTGKSFQQSGSNRRCQVERIKEGQTGEEKWQQNVRLSSARRKQAYGSSEC